MPYSIDRYNGTTLTVVEDGTIDSTLDIKLIGKNYAGYGEVQNENFLHLLENFSSTAAPPRPISGQLWFDSNKNKLKFYDKNNVWRTTGGAEVKTTPPAGLSTGDFWFDNGNNQLYARTDADDYVLIGPQTAPGLGTTQMRSRTVVDTPGGGIHAIVEAVINDETVYIISADEFTVDTAIETDLTGFSVIKKGLTLVNTGTTGVTTGSTHTFWGTASYATKTNSLNVAGTYRTAATTATASTIASRDGSGDLYANIFQGVASSAQYADLAEKYLADAEYEVGTVVCIGGSKEITAATYGNRAIGIVSGAPAFIMNSHLEGGTLVALKGRVPVKVQGTIKKGDKLVPAQNMHGAASSANESDTDYFAIALQDHQSGSGVIEALVL